MTRTLQGTNVHNITDLGVNYSKSTRPLVLISLLNAKKNDCRNSTTTFRQKVYLPRKMVHDT